MLFGDSQTSQQIRWNAILEKQLWDKGLKESDRLPDRFLHITQALP
jgi:hypothetical protein